MHALNTRPVIMAEPCLFSFFPRLNLMVSPFASVLFVFWGHICSDTDYIQHPSRCQGTGIVYRCEPFTWAESSIRSAPHRANASNSSPLRCFGMIDDAKNICYPQSSFYAILFCGLLLWLLWVVIGLCFANVGQHVDRSQWGSHGKHRTSHRGGLDLRIKVARQWPFVGHFHML